MAVVAAVLVILIAWPRSSSDLTSDDWRLTTIIETTPAFQGVVPPLDQSKFTVRFDTDGTLDGVADCNAFSGTYTTGRSNALTITVGPATLVACPDGSFSALFVHALASATDYATGNDQLTITLRGGGSLVFAKGRGQAASPSPAGVESSPSGSAAVASATPATESPASAAPTSQATPGPTPTPPATPTPEVSVAPSADATGEPTPTTEPTPDPTPAATPTPTPQPSPGADLVGRIWHLTSITELAPAFQGVVPIADQDRYTLEFQTDGSLGAQADCNRLVGTWTATSSGDLAIDLGASSVVACPEGSLSDLYVLGLSNVASYSIANDGLTITLRDGGTLVYR